MSLSLIRRKDLRKNTDSSVQNALATQTQMVHCMLGPEIFAGH